VLAFSAVAVQSAGATVAVSRTAFTCVEGQGVLEFEDGNSGI